MYYSIVRQFLKTLGNLDAILGKATAYAEARKFPVDNFCDVRLAPDMLTFTRQIQILCDTAKNATAGLAGKEPPKMPDEEKTVAALRERIAKTRAYIESFSSADFEKTHAKTTIKVPNPPGKVMYAEAAILSRALPNFFFHVVTAYNILRAGGVDIGKMDYLGQLEMMDA